MPHRPKVFYRERRVEEPTRKITSIQMRSPAEIIQLVILKKTVIRPIVQRNEPERDSKTRSNLRQPRAPSKLRQ
jgi:hypothetical protein